MSPQIAGLESVQGKYDSISVVTNFDIFRFVKHKKSHLSLEQWRASMLEEG